MKGMDVLLDKAIVFRDDLPQNTSFGRDATPMKRKPKAITVPKTGSPVLDAWALISQLESEGIDVRSELDKISGKKATMKVDPPTKISPEGIPMISREKLQSMTLVQVGMYLYDCALCAATRGNVEWDCCIQRLRVMPRHWRLAYSLGLLQAEVDNGGHEQFFTNGRGDFDAETEADLQWIGATPFLELFVEARGHYYNASPDYTERLPEVEPLDDAFYKQQKNLFAWVGEYALAHLADYCVD